VTCCGREGGCVCAKEAKCSCGKQSALHCNCEKAQTENTISGARCSCSKYHARLRLCSSFRADTPFQTNVPLVPVPAAVLLKRMQSHLVLPAPVASDLPVRPFQRSCSVVQSISNIYRLDSCTCSGTEKGAESRDDLETDFTTKPLRP